MSIYAFDALGNVLNDVLGNFFNIFGSNNNFVTRSNSLIEFLKQNNMLGRFQNTIMIIKLFDDYDRCKYNNMSKREFNLMKKYNYNYEDVMYEFGKVQEYIQEIDNIPKNVIDDVNIIFKMLDSIMNEDSQIAKDEKVLAEKFIEKILSEPLVKYVPFSELKIKINANLLYDFKKFFAKASKEPMTLELFQQIIIQINPFEDYLYDHNINANKLKLQVEQFLEFVNSIEYIHTETLFSLTDISRILVAKLESKNIFEIENLNYEFPLLEEIIKQILLGFPENSN